MSRIARVDIGNEIYHVINRAVGRTQIFNKAKDYQLFEDLLLDAKEEFNMRILAYVMMPNHWHLLLRPREDGDLGIFMHRLTNKHTRQVHVQTKTIGHGPLYQGRYKSFLVDTDNYYFTLIKYIERNPVRAKLVNKCEDWKWGSAWRRINGEQPKQRLLNELPQALPENYQLRINTTEKEGESDQIRCCVNKGAPYGNDKWVDMMVKEYNLESTKRAGGRPKKLNHAS